MREREREIDSIFFFKQWRESSNDTSLDLDDESCINMRMDQRVVDRSLLFPHALEKLEINFSIKWKKEHSYCCMNSLGISGVLTHLIHLAHLILWHVWKWLASVLAIKRLTIILDVIIVNHSFPQKCLLSK